MGYLMKRKHIPIVLLITILIHSNYIFAQTTLSAGNLALTTINADGGDGFSFVPFIDLDINTEIRFTDNGWNTATDDFTSGSEGIITWTATSAISAGTEIIVSNPSTATPSVNDGSVSKSGTFNLSGGGDQILVYQGTEASPTFIYCFNHSASGFSILSNTLDTNLPDGLTNNVNAYSVTTHADNWQVKCSSTQNDTPENLLALFMIESNYNTNSASEYTGGATSQAGCSYSPTPVPVELTFFSANIFQGNIVELHWNTATEVNNYGFSVERRQQATDGRPNVTPSGIEEWEAIGFVLGHGNSNSPKDYSFLDEKLTNGKYYYRLKQIDYDGSYEYSNTIEISLSESLPSHFVLNQNYPNPFNPSTVISYQLSAVSDVELTIYDALGKELTKLVNEKQSIGSYSYNFDAEGLPSGTYIYELRAGNLIETKKMILIK